MKFNVKLHDIFFQHFRHIVINYNKHNLKSKNKNKNIFTSFHYFSLGGAHEANHYSAFVLPMYHTIVIKTNVQWVCINVSGKKYEKLKLHSSILQNNKLKRLKDKNRKMTF